MKTKHLGASKGKVNNNKIPKRRNGNINISKTLKLIINMHKQLFFVKSRNRANSFSSEAPWKSW